MLSEKCFVVFDVFSFPPGVYVGTLNLIASIPGPSILTLYYICIAVPLHIAHLYICRICLSVYSCTVSTSYNKEIKKTCTFLLS